LRLRKRIIFFSVVLANTAIAETCGIFVTNAKKIYTLRKTLATYNVRCEWQIKKKIENKLLFWKNGA
jgi:predicted molibdopterin-dependent oxidoreductase YjgC